LCELAAGFNGAAASKPRKSQKGQDRFDLSGTLQRSRGIEAAEEWASGRS